MPQDPEYPELVKKKILEELDRLDSKCKDRHILTIFGGEEPLITKARIIDDYFLSVNAKDSLELIAHIAYFKGLVDGAVNAEKKDKLDYARVRLKQLLNPKEQ